MSPADKLNVGLAIMRILVSGINYAPDLIGVAKYTNEMCNFLSAKGHEVRVVTAPPYYPDWRVAAPYSAHGFTSEMVGDVKVLRCPLYVPKSPTGLRRIVHHLSFALTSAPVLMAEALRFRPDIILSIAPSLLGGPAAVVAGKLTGAATWMHIQDFEVDAAFDMNFFSGARFKGAALWFESKVLRAFDVVSSISRIMVDMLQDKGVARTRAIEFRNWVDISRRDPAVEKAAITATRESLLGPGQSVIALYAGNMGAKQGLDILAGAASRLATARPEMLFVFCGSGATKSRLKQSTDGLPNVKFLDLQPEEVFRNLLASTDIHLIPQIHEIQDLALPSKLGGMLASGRSIIAMAEEGTQLATELCDVSVVIPPADVDALVTALMRLADAPALRDMLGQRGLQLAELRWDRNVVLAEFEERLQEFLSKRRHHAFRKAGMAAGELDPERRIP